MGSLLLADLGQANQEFCLMIQFLEVLGRHLSRNVKITVT